MKYRWLSVLLLACSTAAYAHKFSDSYLHLEPQAKSITLQWDIALRDLDRAIGLDTNQDGHLTWGEVRNQRDRIEGFALSRIELRYDEHACALLPSDLLINQHSDGAYAVLRMTTPCVMPLTLRYELLFDTDPQHRGILTIAGQNASRLFSPEQRTHQLDATDVHPATGFASYFREGVRHIVTGYDHVLFLLTLLIPAVLIRRQQTWQPVNNFYTAFVATASVITAFTLAHSLTLGLATLNILTPPIAWVEAAIALSVILAALNNLWPVVTKRRWLMAFVFGLIHGFGFATVLNDANIENGGLLWALGAFNLGVEAGQLAIVALLMPLAYAARHAQSYRQRFLPLASCLAALMGAAWLMQRLGTT